MLPKIERGTKTLSHGMELWYYEGRLHRDFGPAIINQSGCQEWWHLGKRHRDHDLPAIIHPDGTKYWFMFDKRHRTTGPAYISHDNKCVMWCFHDLLYSFEYWCELLEKSEDEIILLKLKYGGTKTNKWKI